MQLGPIVVLQNRLDSILGLAALYVIGKYRLSSSSDFSALSLAISTTR